MCERLEIELSNFKNFQHNKIKLEKEKSDKSKKHYLKIRL